MPNDSKTKSWEAYREFYNRSGESPTEDEFTNIWRGLAPYVRAVIKGKVYNCSDFDLDDYMADAQFMLWERMCQRKLPVQQPAIFIAAVKVMTRQMLIDCHRKNDAERRTRDGYADRVESVHQPCFATQMWAVEMLKKHKMMIARLMSKRSRFKEVNLKLTAQIVVLFQKNAKLALVIDVIERTGYWDPKFLLEHLQVLYRWCYYELRAQTLGLVA
jgi:hypothetical protein